MTDGEIPCGRCDIGTYDYFAATNPIAVALFEMSESDRKENMPMCKTFNRHCLGACEFNLCFPPKSEEYQNLLRKGDE